MQKIIGLDIGSYSLKAVEIINNFKSYEITNFYETVIPQIDEIPADVLLPTCMEQLFQENNLKADRIVTAMPGQYISSRVLPFNFSDPRKIEAAVLAEIEDAVPFNMEDMILDHQILGNQDGKTIALAVMTRKNFLASFLDHLQRIKIDPKLVEVDSLAFYNLVPYLDVDPDTCYGLIDIGHEKTSVCIVQNGVLRMFRSINLGGRYMTEFLARDLEVDFNEAQRVKHEVSRVLCDADQGSDLSGDQRLIAERMTLAANAIVKELGRTLYAFKTWEKSPVSRLYLSGGTSRIKNLGAYFADQFEIEVKYNRLDETPLEINSDLAPHMPIVTQGVAIGLRAVTSLKRHSTINLRSGEFAYSQDYEALLRGVNFTFRAIALVIALLVTSYGFKYFFYNEQIESIQEQYKKQYFAVNPKAKKRSARVPFERLKRDASRKLKNEIAIKSEVMNAFLRLNDSPGSLAVLADLSSLIPKEITVDVVEYKYSTNADGTGKLTLKGETDSFESVQKILDSIEKSRILEGVEKKDDSKKPGSDTIQFTINGQYIGLQPKG